MKKSKNKAATPTPAHRSTLHEVMRGRNRRFEDSRTRRAGQRLQKEIRQALD